MPALYNENAPFPASWLEDLIHHGHIAPGRVERRSITDLGPDDVAGPGQRHFFAGIGGWSYALRLAGVSDDADIWTGSCPCQGLSDAGKGLGFLDPRHLWPAWFALIEKCRPPILFGEQVASRLGLEWLDLVFSDLERCGYTVGAADLCAAGVGAPHARQRLYFVAYAHGEPGRLHLRSWGPRQADGEAGGRGEAGRVAHAPGQRSRGGRERASHRREAVEPPRHGAPERMADQPGQRRRQGRQAAGQDRPGSPHDRPHRELADTDGERLEVVRQQQAQRQLQAPERGGAAGDVANAARQQCGLGLPDDAHQGQPDSDREPVRALRQPDAPGGASGVVGDACRPGSGRHPGAVPGEEAQGERKRHPGRRLLDLPVPAGATRGFWGDAEWILCRDPHGGPPVARPVEPGSFPLSHGVPQRVGLLSGYGNAIVPQVAAVFIRAALAAITKDPP